MWMLYALSAALFWGLTYVFRGYIYKHISIYSSLGITYFFFCAIMLLYSYFSGHLRADLKAIESSKTLLVYFILTLVVLLCAEICIGLSISNKNATLAGIVEISYPVFIALFSFLIFKERITLPTIVGGAVVFLGIWIMYYFNR